MLPSANQKSVVLKCCKFGWAGMAASGLRREGGKVSKREKAEQGERKAGCAPTTLRRSQSRLTFAANLGND